MGWPRVLIAGGSIGGLTAAVLLRDLGCKVDVFERSHASLEDRGAGIVVLPVTERYFTERGGPDSRVSLELTYWTYMDREGNVLSADPDHFRFSGWSTIYRALVEAFGPDEYHLGHEMTKACADAWALRDALAGAEGDLASALAAWEPAQLALGHRALARTREMGQASQFDGTMVPGDPAWKFGLWEPGN